MICRKCSAVIPDGSETCPICGKSPNKKKNDKKRLSPAAVTAFVICVLIAAASISIAYLMSSGYLPAALINETSCESSSTTEDFYLITNSTTIPETELTDDNFLLSLAVTENSVLTADGSVAARYGQVEIGKEQICTASQDTFRAFLIGRVLQNSFSWFTIKFDDGTGIVFSANNITCATYGLLSDNGMVEQGLGYIVCDSNGNYCFLPVAESESLTQEESSEIESESESESESVNGSESAVITDSTGESTNVPESTGTTVTEVQSSTAAYFENSTANTTAKTVEQTTSKVTEKSTANSTAASTVKAAAPTETKAPSTQSATAAAKSTTKAQNTNPDSSSTVYITNTGTKYHKAGCASLSQSQIAISRSEAIERGYTPCKRCNP